MSAPQRPGGASASSSSNIRERLLPLRQIAAVRGLDRGTTLGLAGSVVFAVLAAQLSVQLRTPADLNVVSPVLDSGILVGLAVPAAVISRMAQDRSAWIQATSSRSKTLLRMTWALVMFSMAAVVGGLGSLLVPGQQFPALLLADAIALTAAGLLGAVLLGAALGWVVPVVLALVCSIPGLIPVSSNWLVLADRGGEMLLVAAGLAIAATVLFVLFDDYGLAPQARLIQRMPGVVDD